MAEKSTFDARYAWGIAGSGIGRGNAEDEGAKRPRAAYTEGLTIGTIGMLPRPHQAEPGAQDEGERPQADDSRWRQVPPPRLR